MNKKQLEPLSIYPLICMGTKLVLRGMIRKLNTYLNA
jgi:hypothetical protein